MSTLAAVDTAQVTDIATEVFAAMIDGETGFLTPWSRGPISLVDPLHAWVHLSTMPASELRLSTDVDTAAVLTRAFLKMDEAELVGEADVIDAFGEIANIFGGNIKALLPEHADLTLPEVSRQASSDAWAVLLNEVLLAWRGRPFAISVWTI